MVDRGSARPRGLPAPWIAGGSDGLGPPGIQDAAGLGQQGRSGIPLAVALVEALPHDDARLVEDEDAGIGKVGMPRVRLDPVGGMVFLHALVDEAETPDDGAAFVREQRRRDGVLVGEGPKHCPARS